MICVAWNAYLARLAEFRSNVLTTGTYHILKCRNAISGTTVRFKNGLFTTQTDATRRMQVAGLPISFINVRALAAWRSEYRRRQPQSGLYSIESRGALEIVAPGLFLRAHRQ